MQARETGAAHSFVAERAWVAGAWANEVLLSVNAAGNWQRVEPNVEASQHAGATRLSGAVIPGLVNAHSHAFQRAIAGLTEQSATGDDNFWSWRESMYGAANRMTPALLEAVATQLYAELLKGGYTQVCEFHYLHAHGGSANDTDMGMALISAAQRVGMRLTMLPTLYMRSGFAAAGLRPDQARFASTPERILRLREAYALHCDAGAAIHSLRAVAPAQIAQLERGLPPQAPLHIHIAEQQQEVSDCLAQLGTRPVQWLLDNLPVNRRWHLVHATHMTAEETRALAKTGASVVICPSTEANLGDGVVDFPALVSNAVPWSIGSDSHVSRSAFDELRLLEYSQRLRLQRRNVGVTARQSSTAAALFEAALAGGAAAAGLPVLPSSGGLQAGARADFCVLDESDASLLGVSAKHTLDAAVFSSPNQAVRDVYVAGRCVVRDRGMVSTDDGEIKTAFVHAMKTLWS
jgi:formimidoylglutamate deiminase